MTIWPNPLPPYDGSEGLSKPPP